METSAFNRTLAAAFLAVSCLLPAAAIAAPQEAQQAISGVNRPPMTPEIRQAMVSLAEIKLAEAKDPARAGLEAWSRLRQVQIYLEYAEYDLNGDEGYSKLGMTRTAFLELVDRNASIAITNEIKEMRNPEHKGLVALGAADLVRQAADELSGIRKQPVPEVLSSFGTSKQEVDNSIVTNARFGAQQILDSVKARELEGADAWTALVDMLQFMQRGQLNPRTDDGFRAINSSLAEYQQLKHKHALLAATDAWEKANLPENAGEDALYHLDMVQTYLRRAGYNTGRGEGFPQVKTTKEAFQKLWEKNEGIQRNKAAPANTPMPS